MAIRANETLLRQIRTLYDFGVIGDLTDARLLERFTTRDREAAERAFAALVERHGPMVLRVCRNLLKNPHDAQDAFQATFLVLVQKARGLWVKESLAPWLHQVAHRVASRARASTVRRRERERHAAERKPIHVCDDDKAEDLLGLLHTEIDRLPERYRVAVVVCDLEGLSHERAARHLGWPVGTVKSRLARARQLLRTRLIGRGLTSLAILAITEAATSSVDAAVSLRLVESTLQAAVFMAKARTIGVISVRVANLAEEVLKTMFLTKLKLILAPVLITFALVAGTASVLGRQGNGIDPGPAADHPKAKRPDLARPATDGGSTEVPAFIRQARGMIVARLEQELAQAKNRLERTLRRVVSPNDPAAVRGRKTVDEIEGLLARIDGVLVDAVDRFPTMFDFSGGQGEFPSSNEKPGNGQESNIRHQAGGQNVNSPENKIDLESQQPTAKRAQQQNSNQNPQTNANQKDQQNANQNPQQNTNQPKQPSANAEGSRADKGNQRSAAHVAGIADVEVTVSERKRMIDVGGQTTFQIRLQNNGTKEVTHLRVTANLSQNLEYVQSGASSHDVGVRFRSQENAVTFQRIDKLGPGKEIILGVTARVKGSAPKLATCRVSVSHDELPEGDKLEDMAGVKVMNAGRE